MKNICDSPIKFLLFFDETNNGFLCLTTDIDSCNAAGRACAMRERGNYEKKQADTADPYRHFRAGAPGVRFLRAVSGGHRRYFAGPDSGASG